MEPVALIGQQPVGATLAAARAALFAEFDDVSGRRGAHGGGGAHPSLPPHEILHTKVAGDGFASETWQLTSPPYSFLAYKGPGRAGTPEQAGRRYNRLLLRPVGEHDPRHAELRHAGLR